MFGCSQLLKPVMRHELHLFLVVDISCEIDQRFGERFLDAKRLVDSGQAGIDAVVVLAHSRQPTVSVLRGSFNAFDDVKGPLLEHIQKCALQPPLVHHRHTEKKQGKEQGNQGNRQRLNKMPPALIPVPRRELGRRAFHLIDHGSLPGPFVKQGSKVHHLRNCSGLRRALTLI